jgi:hypothetical protein
MRRAQLLQKCLLKIGSLGRASPQVLEGLLHSGEGWYGLAPGGYACERGVLFL